MPGASEHGISVQLDVNAMGKLNALLLSGDTHCLIPYRNALRSTIGGAINSKLHHAPGCLSVIPDNTGVRSIACIAAKIRSTNKHAVRKCDRERNGSIGSVYCTYIYPLSICLSLAKAYIANASGWTIDIQPMIEPV